MDHLPPRTPPGDAVDELRAQGRAELIAKLEQARRLAGAELSPLIDRVSAIDRSLGALIAGAPIEACHLEDLDPNDQAVDA